MTVEEARRYLEIVLDNNSNTYSDDFINAVKIAIKALEQASCEDAISRQAAIETIMDLCKYYTPTKSVNHPHMDFVIGALQDLPPINPQMKTGHWIKKGNQVACSNCDFSMRKDLHRHWMRYCPNCGAKMESEK